MPPVSTITTTTTARSLRIKARIIEAAIRHLEICIEIEVAATLALNRFQTRYTLAMRNTDPLLRAEETRLIAVKTKAWNDRFAAWRAANPPTIEDVLWIVAKNGYTDLISKLINLSKFTRICQNLQPVMREVKNRYGWTQLHYFCMMGKTASVMRMLAMKSIDVEAKEDESGITCLMEAANDGHLDICRLLIDKGAQLEAKSSNAGLTPLHYAADRGFTEIVRLLCDRGADIESHTNGGWRPLHSSSYNGHISIVKELIEERNAEINSKIDDGSTSLRLAREYNKPDVTAFFVSHGGIN
jgi:hypothetical protein